jgi:uncharacterized protein YceK
MLRPSPIAIILLLLALAAGSGCGTVWNISPHGSSHAAGPNVIYGGVQIDGMCAVDCVLHPREEEQPLLGLLDNSYGVALCMLDLPFSFVGDTLTLYTTIPATVKRLTAPPKGAEPAGASAPQEDAAVTPPGNTPP